MRFHYDLAQAEPIIRDYPVYDSSATGLLNGQAMSLEGAITTAINRFALQKSNPATLDNFVGVLAESGLDASSTAAASGVTIYGKMVINPLAVYYCEYSQNADDDTVNTSASSTGKVTTATFTTDREGDWIYVTDEGSTTGGAGNLSQIGASTSTTSVTAVTSYDDNLEATNTSDTFVVITNPFSALAAGGSLDLSNTTAIYGTQISGVAAEGTGALIVLNNYIETSSTGGEQVLRVQSHSGKNFPAAATRIYADIQFSDSLLIGATVSNRIIS